MGFFQEPFKEKIQVKGGNRDWTGDLSICSRMLYHWAMPPQWMNDKFLQLIGQMTHHSNLMSPRFVTCGGLCREPRDCRFFNLRINSRLKQSRFVVFFAVCMLVCLLGRGIKGAVVHEICCQHRRSRLVAHGFYLVIFSMSIKLILYSLFP